MEVSVHSFWLPKAGNEASEYEDAFACDERRGLFALTDGASDAFESRLFAQSLVKRFVDNPCDGGALVEWVKTCAGDWNRGISWSALPWYGLEKARIGAFSTFLGLRLKCNGKRGIRYDAFAVGDSCFFHIRRGRLIRRFPLKKSGEFGVTPPLLSTSAQYNERLAALGAPTSCGGWLKPGDTFMLATDALACWFLKAYESGGNAWKVLPLLVALPTPDLEMCVHGLRSLGEMRNDDVTVVVGEVGE